MPLELEEMTGKIIEAAIEVHKILGPGFIESVYENALALEFEERGIPFKRQLEIPVPYKTGNAGKHRLDMFVFENIVVELKATKNIENIHFAFARSYVKAIKREHGLILNFSKPTLEIKRVIYKE